jgi:Fic family protein
LTDLSAKERFLKLRISRFVAGSIAVSRFNEWVRVGSHIGTAPAEINQKISAMLIEYFSDPSQSIIYRIAKFHLEFESIHPFVDGNGRIGRVLINYLLQREGYVPINIKYVDRAQYYQAFRDYDLKFETTLMELIVFRALTSSYHKRLAYLEGGHIITLNEYAKKHRLSHSNFINKAKRQTIEAFIEKGIWKISDKTTVKN